MSRTTTLMMKMRRRKLFSRKGCEALTGSLSPVDVELLRSSPRCQLLIRIRCGRQRKLSVCYWQHQPCRLVLNAGLHVALIQVNCRKGDKGRSPLLDLHNSKCTTTWLISHGNILVIQVWGIWCFDDGIAKHDSLYTSSSTCNDRSIHPAILYCTPKTAPVFEKT